MPDRTSTTSTLEILAKNLVGNIEAAGRLWKEMFSDKFEDIWCPDDRFIEEKINTGRNSSLDDILNSLDIRHINHALSELTNRLNESRGVDQKNGHSSLFLREPLSDRLILTASTSNNLNPPVNLDCLTRHLADVDNNYDGDSKFIFYDLCDRLSDSHEEKISPASRACRGLTGWVAVAGYPLVINNEKDELALEEIGKADRDASRKCDLYGAPKWGSRVSEFEVHDWNSTSINKRLLAVPIRAVSEDEEVIGVLRYSSDIETPTLGEIELQFLTSIAGLIAGMINLGRVRILSERQSRLDKNKTDFERTGDTAHFLQFIARSMRSKISSLYIKLGREQHTLRLFDAHGISDLVGVLRNDDRIRDYSERNNGRSPGLTWEYLVQDQNMPVVHDSVVASERWSGSNTLIFYEKSLPKRKIPDLQSKLEKWESARDLLKTYTIKIIGMPLIFESDRIGVLKVEFPCSFDKSTYYRDQDIRFFFECGELLAKEIHGYRDFIEGDWFESHNEKHADQFARYIRQITRLQLVSIKDNCKFWQKVAKYVQKNKALIDEELTCLLKSETCDEDLQCSPGLGEKLINWLSTEAKEYFPRNFKELTDLIWLFQKIFS